MGTKVQWKGYLSGFCTMRDLNVDADSSWSQYYGNKALGRNLIGHCQQTGQSSRYSGYDKESIKRTMLEHDAIFRNQLYELHRLYSRQKELMDELQKKGPYKYLQADTSQSNSFSSQIPSNGTNRIWHMPSLPVTSTSYNKVPIAIIDDKVSPLNFLKESSSAQSGPVLIGKRAAVEDADIIDSNHKRRPRRMFDLELPADVYIDCEDAEKSEKDIVAESSSVTMNPLNGIQTTYPDNDVKFALGTIKARNCRGDGWKSDLCTQNGLTAHSLADLNEPVKENICEKTGPVSYDLLSLITTLEDNQGERVPTRLNTNCPGLQSDFFRAKLNEEGTYPNPLHSDKEVTQERSFFNYEAGQSMINMTLFSPGSAREKLPTSSETTQLKLKRPLEIPSPNKNKGDLWFKQTQARGIEISGRRLPHEQSASSMANSFSVLPTASPFLPSWTNLPNSGTQVPLAVQSLPFFNGAVARKHSSPSKWQQNGDLRSHLRLGANQSSCQNGFNDREFTLDYDSAITFSKPHHDSCIDNENERHGTQMTPQMNLNQLLLNGFQDRRTSQSKTAVSDFKGMCDSPSGVLSLLRKPSGTPSSHIELDYSQGYPQLKPSTSAIFPGPEKKQEKEESLPLFNMQDLPSTSQVPESSIANTRLFGFSLFDKTEQTPTFSSSLQECIEKDEIKALSLENQTPLGGLVTKSSSKSRRNQFNLNSDPNTWETPDESEILANPSQFSAPGVASEINLEVPVTSQAEKEKSDEALVNEAAGNIIWMLTDKCKHLDNISCPPFPPIPFDTLHCFADIVSSGAKELDMFEHMTLELEETKPEDYWHSPWKEEDREEDDDERKSTVASLFFAKPRRGQGRKRRQRKDFQKDILPGLASLSRQEVTADIQTIRGLMKVSGQSWEAGGTKRRKTGRNRTNSRARRDVRPRNLTEVGAPLLPPEPVGWGRTTRRCRRQRGPPVTNVAASIT